MSIFFKDKVAIVTGASSGIGLETARLLWQKGAKVVLAARRKEVLDSLSQKINGSLAIPTDVCVDKEVSHLVEATLEKFGRIDILINNAGILLYKPIIESSEDEIRHLMEVNYFGALRCVSEVIPQMQKQGAGTIVNVASVAGKIGLPNIGHYSASKFALVGYSEALRQELKQYGIFVSLICPGLVETPMNEELIQKARSKGKRVNPITPESVAETILVAISKRKSEIMLPLPTRIFYWAHLIFPKLMEALAWKFRASDG